MLIPSLKWWHKDLFNEFWFCKKEVQIWKVNQSCLGNIYSQDLMLLANLCKGESSRSLTEEMIS